MICWLLWSSSFLEMQQSWPGRSLCAVATRAQPCCFLFNLARLQSSSVSLCFDPAKFSNNLVCFSLILHNLELIVFIFPSIIWIIRVRFALIFPMCGKNRVIFSSMILISGISRVRFASIFLWFRISRVCFASIYTSSGISKVCFALLSEICQDWRPISLCFNIVDIAISFSNLGILKLQVL